MRQFHACLEPHGSQPLSDPVVVGDVGILGRFSVWFSGVEFPTKSGHRYTPLVWGGRVDYRSGRLSRVSAIHGEAHHHNAEGGKIIRLTCRLAADGGDLARAAAPSIVLTREFKRSARGQSWAEKSLKNGRIIVGFQELRKPQDTKGPYFPRNSPSTLPEWGSGAPTDDGKPNRLGANAPVKPCRSFGGIDLRAHAEIVSVRRSDTPKHRPFSASADVAGAVSRDGDTCRGSPTDARKESGVNASVHSGWLKTR